MIKVLSNYLKNITSPFWSNINSYFKDFLSLTRRYVCIHFCSTQLNFHSGQSKPNLTNQQVTRGIQIDIVCQCSMISWWSPK